MKASDENIIITDAAIHITDNPNLSLFLKSIVTLNFVIGDAFAVSFCTNFGISDVSGAGLDIASDGIILEVLPALIIVDI